MDPIVFVPPVLCASATAAAILVLLRRGRLPLDRPNDRSLHEVPTPRSGGLGLIPAVLFAWLFVPGGIAPSIWVGLAVVFVVSAVDDLRGLPAIIRLVCHLAASGLVVNDLLAVHHGIWMAVGIALVLAWMMNLYNFMDGADGLAGTMACVGFATYAAAAWLANDVEVVLVCVTICAGSASFLLFNFPPARVFLGDAGSISLGAMAGFVGLLGWDRGLWPGWFPVLAFLPFIMDASVTLVRRLARGERIWEAHRTHYYQRLVQIGWGHRRTLFVELALMVAGSALALAALQRSVYAQAVLVTLSGMIHLGFMAFVDLRWSRRVRSA